MRTARTSRSARSVESRAVGPNRSRPPAKLTGMHEVIGRRVIDVDVG